jgi:hypothetical protein
MFFNVQFLFKNKLLKTLSTASSRRYNVQTEQKRNREIRANNQRLLRAGNHTATEPCGQA